MLPPPPAIPQACLSDAGLPRELRARRFGLRDYPLSSRFEEMDALVICDRVRVPRDRIFLCGDADAAIALTRESQFHAQVSHPTLCRYIAKTELFLGTAGRERLFSQNLSANDGRDPKIGEQQIGHDSDRERF